MLNGYRTGLKGGGDQQLRPQPHTAEPRQEGPAPLALPRLPGAAASPREGGVCPGAEGA